MTIDNMRKQLNKIENLVEGFFITLEKKINVIEDLIREKRVLWEKVFFFFLSKNGKRKFGLMRRTLRKELPLLE